MSTRRKELLLAAIHRSTRPLTSGEAVDKAHGLAIAEGWPLEQLEELTRRSASSLLQSMEKAGVLMFAGDVLEDGNTRSVPTYKPVGEYNPGHPIPDAPEVPRAPKRQLGLDTSKKQLLEIIEEQTQVLDAQADIIACFQRFQSDVRSRMDGWNRKIGPLKAIES